MPDDHRKGLKSRVVRGQLSFPCASGPWPLTPFGWGKRGAHKHNKTVTMEGRLHYGKQILYVSNTRLMLYILEFIRPFGSTS